MELFELSEGIFINATKITHIEVQGGKEGLKRYSKLDGYDVYCPVALVYMEGREKPVRLVDEDFRVFNAWLDQYRSK